jgi:site-specific DNA-methyltransferase (adenine-specific)
MIIQGDCYKKLKELKSESIDCVITSPPYWNLRDYGVAGQLGLESTFQEYINKLCDIFDEVKRVLKKSGTCWVNIGDTYGGSGKGYGDKNPDPKFKNGGRERSIQPPPTNTRNKAAGEVPKIEITKSLCQIPARFAIEMTNRGWILRNEIIWHKPNCMPSSADDRFTVDFEKIFFFVKNKNYYFETQFEQATYTDSREGLGRQEYENRNTKCGVVVNGKRNKRTVWKISTKGFSEAHFATFPEELIETPIMAGCPKDGLVLDPFSGAATTGVVAKKLNRKFIGIEINQNYIHIAEERLRATSTPLL